jgi:hypothetical protein
MCAQIEDISITLGLKEDGVQSGMNLGYGDLMYKVASLSREWRLAPRKCSIQVFSSWPGPGVHQSVVQPGPNASTGNQTWGTHTAWAWYGDLLATKHVLKYNPSHGG